MKKTVLFSFIAVSASVFGQHHKGWSELNDFIQQQMEVFNVPGLSATIIVGDSIIWANHFGYASLEENIPVSDSTLFCVLSIGKSLSTTVAMKLYENGLLGLDQNINDILPFQVINPHNNLDLFTPRMLMSHSSSIRDFNLYNYATIGDPTIGLGFFMLNYLSPGQYYSISNYYPEVPGSQYHYCNIAPSLTGYLVEVITETSFKDYARDSLLVTLEMINSGWFLEDIELEKLAIGYDFGAGGFQANPFFGHLSYPALTLRTSALELSNYVMMLLNNGMFKGIQVLQPASVDSMTTIQNPFWGGSFGKPGLGLYHRTDMGNREVWGHNGGSTTGYAAQIYYCLEENTGVVVTTNSNQYVDPIVIQLFKYAGLFVIANPASDITSSSFQVNWESASTATGYLLDVAFDDEFVNFLSEYENLNIGLLTDYTVSGLVPETDYYYRLRAYNNADTGAYSNPVHAQTLLGTEIDQLSKEKVKVWINGQTLYIDIADTPEAIANFYSITGQRLNKVQLKKGLNGINLDFSDQAFIVNIAGNQLHFSKKIIKVK